MINYGGDLVKENIIMRKSFAFSVRIMNLQKYLSRKKGEYVVSRQICKSGTSIGANITEAQDAQSKADFLSKLNISLKETGETLYWLRLLHATDYLTEKEFEAVYVDCEEIKKILVASIKTLKA